jgi:hypothetical protein
VRFDEYSKSDWIFVDPRLVFVWRNNELPLLSELLIRCPVCKFESTHLERVFALRGSGSDWVGLETDTELYGARIEGHSNANRGCLVLRFWGECEDLFEILVQQDRGSTLVKVRYASKPRAWPTHGEPTQEHPMDSNNVD